jgi:hypothetical protein
MMEFIYVGIAVFCGQLSASLVIGLVDRRIAKRRALRAAMEERRWWMQFGDVDDEGTPRRELN